MVVAVMVVKLDNAVVAVAAMDVVLIQIIVAHRTNFLKNHTIWDKKVISLKVIKCPD